MLQQALPVDDLPEDDEIALDPILSLFRTSDRGGASDLRPYPSGGLLPAVVEQFVTDSLNTLQQLPSALPVTVSWWNSILP